MRQFNCFHAASTVSTLLFAVVLAWATPLAKASQIGRDMNEADAELNRVYHQALDSLAGEHERALLRESQRAWVAFVEAEVSLHTGLYTTSKGGSFIRLELTQTRITQLRFIAARTSANGYNSGKED